MKNILIFGAGINQITLIKACNDLGFNSIVIDPSDNPPGKQFAKHYFKVAPDDYELTKEVAIKMNIDGIVTGQMENPLKIMSKLANEMGYIFNSPEIIQRSTNKYLMKQAFLQNNVACAKGLYFSSKEELNESKLKDFSYPLILKPVDSHSSRGVYRVLSYNEILNYLDETISFSREGAFLIEEFIDGPEFSVESVTYNGKTEVIQITEKIITPFPNVVELGHIQPAELTDKQKEQIKVEVIKAINALGINNTVSHTELKITEKGPIIIEIGARLGGDFISSFLTKSSCGVDLDKASVQVCLGIEPNLNHSVSKYVYVKYFTLPPKSIVDDIIENKLIDEFIKTFFI